VSKEEIQTTSAPAAIGPYSQGIRCGNLLFCSGQIPLNPQTGQLVTGSIEEETHQVLKNLAAIVTAGGGTLDQVVKTTIFLKDLGHFAVVNTIYGEYFRKPFPARACVQVAKLPKDVSVEIDAIVNVSNASSDKASRM